MKNWKEFINKVIEKDGQFSSVEIDTKGNSEFQIFKSKDITSLTEIRVGYLSGNQLIYLHIFNPKIPGYNKYIEGTYFYQHQFNEEGKTYGNPALEFNEINKKGVLSILGQKLKGREVQYLKNNKILKSKLFISEYDSEFNYTYDFSKKSFFEKLFSKKIENKKDAEVKEISLEKIFNGIDVSKFLKSST